MACQKSIYRILGICLCGCLGLFSLSISGNADDSEKIRTYEAQIDATVKLWEGDPNVEQQTEGKKESMVEEGSGEAAK
ncbi:MAG: hypothetical protein MUP70_04570 [Candidatus Aminicenantes bacterium]|nr:hypothetical protein [Candidatus Aminicenantes bacterium]